jgi:hypothetical protein
LAYRFGCEFSHLARRGGGIGRVKDRGPGNERISAGVRQLSRILEIHSPIDLDPEAGIIA